MKSQKIILSPKILSLILLIILGVVAPSLLLNIKNKYFYSILSDLAIPQNTNNTQLLSKSLPNSLSTTKLNNFQPDVKSKVVTLTVPPQFSGAIVYQAKLLNKEKYIALTFDDGPWLNSTAGILKILHQNNVKGTFFVLGRNIQQYPKLAMQIVAEGHAIGNHTWHHWYHFLNQQTAAFEIDRTANLISQITGMSTTLFRPPGGILSNGPAAYARKKNYTIVMWSDDSQDYRRPSVNTLVNRVLKQAKPGGIVLMHDGGGNRARTVAALPQIISQLKQRGYSFVTIPELLEIQSKEQNLQTSKLN